MLLSSISHAYLHSFHIVDPRSAYAPPVVVRYMSGTCPVHVRFYTGLIPDIYRTSTGHELEILPCYMLVPLGRYY